jgi:3-oxoacyl-[acyl-carrier-protein] synthase III
MTDQAQAKLKKRLETILKIPENQMCSDCGKRGNLSSYSII